jgi:transposase
VSVYREANREDVQKRLPNAALRWQMESLYRELDMLSTERRGAHRMLGDVCRDIPEVELLASIPGVGLLIARTLVAWIVTPSRFLSDAALNSYAGLGLGQGVTNWQPIGHARASKRGQRKLKRVLFIAACAAIKGKNGFARRYEARIQAGWKHRNAIRDIAKKILITAVGMWEKGCVYNDDLVSVPVSTGS